MGGLTTSSYINTQEGEFWMKIKSRALGALAALVTFASVTGTAVAADRPYAEGTVSVVSSIRTEPGQHENYMKYLATTYKQMMDEQKKAGIIPEPVTTSALFPTSKGRSNAPRVRWTTRSRSSGSSTTMQNSSPA